MVAVTGWVSTPQSRRRYRQIIDAGINADGYRHVYGANLAVRWDGYRGVDGFVSVAHGEDTRFGAASSPAVTTSPPPSIRWWSLPGECQVEHQIVWPTCWAKPVQPTP